MISVGIKNAKNNLSRLLLRVKSGEEVLLTERGKPIARIVREGWSADPVRKNLENAAEKGAIQLPVKDIKRNPSFVAISSGKSASEMVIENRR